MSRRPNEPQDNYRLHVRFASFWLVVVIAAIAIAYAKDSFVWVRACDKDLIIAVQY